MNFTLRGFACDSTRVSCFRILCFFVDVYRKKQSADKETYFVSRDDDDQRYLCVTPQRRWQCYLRYGHIVPIVQLLIL